MRKSISDRITDAIIRALATKACVVIYTLANVAWIIYQSVLLKHPWAPYPWVFLNLMMGAFSNVSGILILIGQRKDGKREDAKIAQILRLEAKMDRSLELRAIADDAAALRAERADAQIKELTDLVRKMVP